jgi:hypothetical protein
MHRRVGAVVGHVFRKDRILGSKHFLRKPPAIALDIASLEAALAAGADEVAITDQESNLTYQTTFETIREHGFRFDRGYGQQIGLEFKHWNIGKDTGDPKMETMPLGI